MNDDFALKIEQAPVLPLQNMVIFPNMILPVFIARDISRIIIEDKSNSHIILVAQKDLTKDDPFPKDLYKIGTLCRIIQHVQLADGTIKIMIEGEKRVQLNEYTQDRPFMVADYVELPNEDEDNEKHAALFRALAKSFVKYIKKIERNSTELIAEVENTSDIDKGSNLVASNLSIKNSEKQDILEETKLSSKLSKLIEMIELELQILETETSIRDRIKKQIDEHQKSYLLQEQMKAIQKELNDGEEDPIDEIKSKLDKLNAPAEVKERIESEIKKLKLMSAMSAESSIVKGYIDCIMELPWRKFSVLNKNFAKSKEILDNDHYGLEKIKERIYELLAVQMRVKKSKSSIMCLFGPPGVGKTSVAKSIAKAMGRPFVRISLGGVHDEAEIRGHRRTYIGAMPGKIIQAIKKAKVSNPLILLDEIGKVGHDVKGDPAAALLEVLDPEQNHAFQDNYLDLGYDLSDVLFVATTNSLNLPPALVDRLEIIRISGYTEMEKVHIAEKHLIARQKKLHGLKNGELSFSRESLHELISKYTREAGVRNLEREIANICRKTVKMIVSKEKEKIHVSKNSLYKLLGMQKYSSDKAELEDRIGVCTGMAWTEMGGDILYIESSAFSGTGKIVSTGHLGDVMKESIQAAMTFIKSQANKYNIDIALLNKTDVHVHVPEGAIPKDGPSAGVAMCCSIMSALLKKNVKRNLAMTGEISLRGRVLPIGGVKEKVLAAHRSGIENIVLPKKNEKDLEEVPSYVKKSINFHLCEYVDEVIQIAIPDLSEGKLRSEDSKSENEGSNDISKNAKKCD
ncbi:endopeptidase La [Candidatus Cytomitobacter indipagum]|uniref:Lon protease n=1 Tax=Candidatus Cytomitobacter indipagum TaxID=2601575 RepID=A0A5C0UCY4_9PROT|nr:endopeptidase La [Candidatus Cytomitobacter indipagum]QEK37886.1 endopeptidase La [Candidatus Cytomitobacter indipagum]